MMDVRTIANALNGDVAGRDTIVAPGPGHSKNDRSLAIKLDAAAPDGFLIFSHCGDDWKICRDYVRTKLGLPPWKPGDELQRTIHHSKIEQWDLAAIEAEVGEGPREWTEDDLTRIAYARDIWDHAKDPRNTLAEKYLREHRKLDLPAPLCASVLRFHPNCPWRNENTGQTERVPALIAAFRSIDNDTVLGIQRIRLNPDGSKFGRRMFGIVRRAAIKLDPVGKEICIGEGLETCLAGRQLGFLPTWALGSAGAISFFPLINDVQKLTIFGEAGKSSADAIKLAGTRWRKVGRRVRVVMPNSGSDLNDVILRQA
jgi:putative DNA primase/helicase